VSRPSTRAPRRHASSRGARVPAALALALAIPALFLLGAVALGTLLVVLAALASAPRRRRDVTDSLGRDHAITLDPSAYRTVRSADQRSAPPPLAIESHGDRRRDG
jgi:hypothetical protein